MSEEMTEKKSREPSVETLAKMLRRRVGEVNELIEKLEDKGIDIDMTMTGDAGIHLGEIKLVKTL